MDNASNISRHLQYLLFGVVTIKRQLHYKGNGKNVTNNDQMIKNVDVQTLITNLKTATGISPEVSRWDVSSSLEL